MSDLEVLKEIPGYKAILKSVLKSQIQLLMEQLSEHTGEESMILTASVHDGSLSHLGSNTGKGFLEGRDEIKSQFLGYCLKTYHKKKTHEPQKPYQRTHPSPRSPAQLPTPPAKRPRVHPVSLARASSQEIYPQPSEISGDGSDSNVGYGNIGAISDSNVLVKTEQYDSGNQNSDINQHEQMAESNESVTFKAAEKSIPETVHLSHTQTSGAASETVADMDSEQEKNETDITDLTSIKVEQVEDELEITGVEMAASNLDNWGQGQAGFGAESDSSFDQSTDQSGYIMAKEEDSKFEAREPLDESLQNTSVKAEVVNDRFKCSICDKSYKTKDNLKRHIKIHDEKFKFSCSYCTLYFTSEHEYNAHNQAKHSTNHLCIICGKTFKKMSHLTDHAAMHDATANPDKVQVCPVDACRKKFIKKTRYEDHMNKHTGVKPYECTLCQRKFHGRYVKNQHERVCAGLVENKCEVCSSVFTDRSALKRHEDSSHGHKMFACVCGKMYAYQSSLYKHKKKANH